MSVSKFRHFAPCACMRGKSNCRNLQVKVGMVSTLLVLCTHQSLLDGREFLYGTTSRMNEHLSK